MAMIRAQVSSVGIVKNIWALCPEPPRPQRLPDAAPALRQCSAR
jgi:hypothetical protein